MGSGYVVPRRPTSTTTSTTSLFLRHVSLLLLLTGMLRAETQVPAGHDESTTTTLNATAAPTATSDPDQGVVVAAYDPEASITGLYTGPYFDPLTPRNMTAHLGDEAKLPCTVRQLGDKSVSWVRVRDADILTVDRYTFVGDERFESHYSPTTETWNLVIKYVQERDAGEYECQVSTEPKMSQLFSLRVVIPKVMIVPVGDRYVKAGSTVKVDCQITDVVQLPDYIFWYHENKRVMDRRDPNLLVAVKRTDVEAITSTLTIHKVRQEQSGNYTCMPSNLHAASVTLHILNEKHPEAMQGERNSASSTHESRLPLTLALVVCVLVWCVSSLGSEGEDNNNSNSNNNKTSTRNNKNKINSNKNNGNATTIAEDDPLCRTAPTTTTTTRALVSFRQSSFDNNHNQSHNHHFLTRPIAPVASSPPFPSPLTPLAPSVFPLADQEHENRMIKLLRELLQLDHLTACSSTTTTSTTSAQGKDINNSEYLQAGTRLAPTTLVLLRHVDEQPQMAPQNTMGARPFIRSFSKTKECGGRALEEALGQHMLGMEEVWGKVVHVNNNNSSLETEHHTCLGDSPSAAHEQIKKQNSSVTEANDLSCRKVEEGQVLSAARQR